MNRGGIMATTKQQLGDFGENFVSKNVNCPSCKRVERSLRLLPTNFKCADLICDFCGYLAQVKSVSVNDISVLPKQIPGAAWGPQKERMQAGIYFPLYIVTKDPSGKVGVYYLPKDLQTEEMFIARKPLSVTAKRAGWQGFIINLDAGTSAPVRIL
jgi:hypothetical protein